MKQRFSYKIPKCFIVGAYSPSADRSKPYVGQRKKEKNEPLKHSNSQTLTIS